MKSFVMVIVLCTLGFVSPQDAGCKEPSAISSPTGITLPTGSSRPTVPKSTEIVSTVHPTHTNQSGISSPTRSQKTLPRHTTVPKSGGNVPTGHPTRRPLSMSNQKPKSPASRGSESLPASITRTPKPQTVSSTIRTTSYQKPESPASRGSLPASTSLRRSYPASTETRNSSTLQPPPTTTATNSTAHKNPKITSKLLSAPTTLTVSNHQTVSAHLGWVIVGIGDGGSVAVEGGHVFEVAGGTTVIIGETSSGEDEPSTVSTSTSSSSSTSPTPYNIYPRPGSTQLQQSAFARNLEQIAQPGSVRSITGSRDKLLLWVASLTPAQASELNHDPVVRGLNVDQLLPLHLERARTKHTPLSLNCSPESCSHEKRDGTILTQQDALDDLKLVSQARGARLAELPGYSYDSRGGQGITVYVIDTGINPNHPEFQNMPGNIYWLHLPGDPPNRSDENGHGTCVASKVVGPTYGVAKGANIAVVKVNEEDDRASISDYIAAWGVVARDVNGHDLWGRAVVMTTFVVDPHRFTENDRLAYIEGLRELTDLDAVVVVASGNIDDEAPGLAIETYPALLARDIPIVVVGAVDTSGIYAPYSQGLASELTVSAVGTVFCASTNGGAVEEEGTSFATGAVAGLAAYLLSLDQHRARLQVQGSVARNVRDLIKELAYARLPLQPAVLWNGIDTRQLQCPVRRDAPSGCPIVNTTLPFGVPPSRVPSPTVNSSSSPPSFPHEGGITLPSFRITGPGPALPLTDLATTTATPAGNPKYTMFSTGSELSSKSIVVVSLTTTIAVGGASAGAGTGVAYNTQLPSTRNLSTMAITATLIGRFQDE